MHKASKLVCLLLATARAIDDETVDTNPDETIVDTPDEQTIEYTAFNDA